MATRKRNQEQAATQTMRVIYPRDGELGEVIGGQSFDVPASVGNKASWIESKWREAQAREQAEAERSDREARVLRERSAQVREQEAQALSIAKGVDADLVAVKRELADIQASVAAPDQQKITEASQAAAALMGRVLDCSRDVAALAEKVEQQHQQAALMLEQGQNERELALKLISNLVEITNGIQKSNGDLINEYAARYTDAAQRAIDLSSEINANWETVQNATRINETAIRQATAASKKLLAEQHQEFLAAMSVAFSAMGVTQEMVENELVRMKSGLLDKHTVVLGPDYLAQMIQVTQKYRDARADAEKRTNLASAQSAGRLNVANLPFITGK